MKAVIYTHYGSPNVLHLAEVDKPVPTDNEVLINIRAAEVTKSDCEMRSFKFPVKWFWLPLRIVFGISKPKKNILGGYFSGVIEELGKAVTKFKPGDPVFGSSQLRLGAYGEYLCLPSNYTIVTKPNNMSFEEAAAVPLGGLNALHFLRKANIQAGEKVLINGAGGSIGTFGVQIAKSMGAEVTVVDSGIKETMLRRIGADHFIDYTQETFTENGQQYDVIFDMVASNSYSSCIRSLKPEGRYLSANPTVSKMLRSFFTTQFTNKTALFDFAGETLDELRKLKSMIEVGKLTSTIDEIYPLSSAPQAHHKVETEQRLGSIVLTFQDDDH